ncbi:type II CRISPR RNA-guided endonuclease Cas9 [Niabella hirudinis]|uniref:type II CRISPR RNA-guided endonuclease Cas9 n=1 Tax=Niabella hirudinis TaxID=1285929 RepID=UPI003EBDB09C
MSKTILGLDLGTNSIGWALIEIDYKNKLLRIIGLGSRIIPMDSQEFSKFNAGQKITSAAGNRTKLHRARITKERYLLRRDRLHLVLNLLEALPEHYNIEIDFERNGKRCGQFKNEAEPKIAYLPTKNSENKHTFYFEEAFEEMIKDLQKVNPSIKNEKGERVPKDWTIYYLRQKALKAKISLEELAWVLLSYNQKRGAELEEIENNDEKSDEIKELLDLQVVSSEQKFDKNGVFYEVVLNDAERFTYKEYTTEQLTFKGDIKEVVKVSKLDESENIEKGKTVYQISDLYELKLANILHSEIDDKNAKHKYDFIYTNGWRKEQKKKKFNVAYQKLAQEITEKNKTIENLFVVSNKFDYKGSPETIIPSIKIPDFNSEGSKDWTLLKKKTEKDAAKFNIDKGYVNNDGSAKHYISPKIYDVLVNDTKTGERTKIIGGLFQTIDRKFYREELSQIVATQREFHKNLEDQSVFEKCVKLLYPNNEGHSKALLANKNAIAHLLIEDILLYQRPLKSKKLGISECKYEIDYWKEDINTITGELTKIPVYKKAVSASHPLFQEFRIWDKIHNIKLIQLEAKDEEGKSVTNIDITSQYFMPEDYKALFEHFNKRSTVTLTDFLKFCKKQFGLEIGKKDEWKILWNYPAEEELKGNETRKSFEIRFKRCGFKDFDTFMSQEKEIELWHYLYSVNQNERKKANEIKEINNPKFGKTSIQNFFTKYFKDENIEEKVFENLCKDFENYPKFSSKYAAYSVKSLRKLLSVMRVGDNFLTREKSDERWQEKYLDRAQTILEKSNQIVWSAKDVDYGKVVVSEVNQKLRELPYPKGLFNTFKDFRFIEDFNFLNLTQSSYFIYGRHSELAQAKYWDNPQKIRDEINTELKHHSLNNPVAEKVLKETMKVVADIWEFYGDSIKNFFTEIHLEVARELQKSNQEKQDITTKQKNSRAENERLKNILDEFLSQSPYNARRGNQDHFERLKIVEEGAKTRSHSEKDFYMNNKEKFEKKEIESILKKQRISKADFEKYKLWIQQGYMSPYTNKPIMLSDLFNGNKYNIDHILPRASVTNDSLNNKIVCEAFLNRLKSDKTAREFISQFGGKTHTIFDEKLNGNVTFELVDENTYVSLVKTQFSAAKRFILLSKEVPTGFTDSQMNNAKHVAKKAMELLSHIVREEGEIEFRSKNLLPVSGAITDKLKKEWKFNQVWTELLTPRFVRLNKLDNSENFGVFETSKSGHEYFDVNVKYILEQNKNFELKRLDHRHHALDALIVALCTENHVQYINNINSGIANKRKEKIGAIKAQRAGIKRQIMYSVPDKENPNEKKWFYMLPGSYRLDETQGNEKASVVDMNWKNNYSDSVIRSYKKVVLETLEHCVVSFQSDFKLVSKSSNKYESYYDKNGELRLDKNRKPIKEFISQKNENKKHWSVRVQLHTDNPSAEIALHYDRLKIIDNIGRADLIKDDRIKDAVKEALGMHNNKVGEVKKYLSKSPISIDGESVEYADFKVVNTKYRKRQPITNLCVRAGAGALPTLDAVKNRIYKIADLKLRNDLLLHLSDNDNDIDKAFSMEAIEEFNRNRKIPVKRLPIAESASLKFTIGKKKSNNHKWVETGGNFHFKITKNDYSIDYETITLRVAINEEKGKLLNLNTAVADTSNSMILSPNDLVYIPMEEEQQNISNVDFNSLSINQINRVYKFVSCTEKEAHFVPYSNSAEIVKNENGTNSKSERLQDFMDNNCTFDKDGKPVMIKTRCIKLKNDRLGNVSKV